MWVAPRPRPWDGADGVGTDNDCGYHDSGSSKCQTAWINSRSTSCSRGFGRAHDRRSHRRLVLLRPAEPQADRRHRARRRHLLLEGESPSNEAQTAADGQQYRADTAPGSSPRAPSRACTLSRRRTTSRSPPRATSPRSASSRVTREASSTPSPSSTRSLLSLSLALTRVSSGYDGKGNPIGGLVFGLKNGNGAAEQFDNWTEFISDTELCIRVCHNGPDAERYCQHICPSPCPPRVQGRR